MNFTDHVKCGPFANMFRAEFQTITLTPFQTNINVPMYVGFRVSLNNSSTYSYKHLTESSSRLPKTLQTLWQQTIVYEYKLDSAWKIPTGRIEINLLPQISHFRLPFVIRLDLGPNQMTSNVKYGLKEA